MYVSASLREQVRQRARLRCEYCHKPEGMTAHAHHIEHILALKHGGLTILDNLAWACFQCNVAKGSDITAYDGITGQLVPVFNPRAQAWDTHFHVDGGRILGITAVGRATARLLRLNQPRPVELRVELMKTGQWPT